MARWSPHRIHEFPQWLRNDTMKYRRDPGMQFVAERTELAADLLDAVIAVHAACQMTVCPTRQAIERVLAGEQ
ncbi:MAG: hypothetical protein KIT69_07390 [Propionibacteriaceae bacterium]|nr:hypothetical protein [Propionibacteriaceae bacterium]